MAMAQHIADFAERCTLAYHLGQGEITKMI